MATEPHDDMPKITIERDDVESFQRSRAQKNKPSSPKIAPSSTDTQPTKASSTPWIVVLLLLLAASGAFGYFLMQQNKVIIQAQERITDLENRLSATGEEMDQSAVALQVKVTELSKQSQDLWEQMDKLWASAWRRNQSDISDLTGEVNKQRSTTDSSIKALTTKQEEQVTALANLNSGLSQSGQSIKTLQDSLNQIKNNNEKFEQQLGSLREKLISSALGNNNLTNKVDELDNKISDLEKKIPKSVNQASSNGQPGIP